MLVEWFSEMTVVFKRTFKYMKIYFFDFFQPLNEFARKGLNCSKTPRAQIEGSKTPWGAEEGSKTLRGKD